MTIELDFEKSVEENASLHFERAKKAKKKLTGLKIAIEHTKELISSIESKPSEKAKPVKKKKQQWFHSLHWFFSSDNFLVIGGRSAKGNEQLVKKHLEEGDYFLHADIPGGSVCIIKAERQEIPETTFNEAAQFAAVFSKAWKQSLPAIDVYAVPPEQVSKKAPSGTSLGTGSFMIYGKRKWFRKTPLKIIVGLNKKGELMGAPPSVFAGNNCAVEIVHGKKEAGGIAKQIVSTLKKRSKEQLTISLDEVIRAIPAENVAVAER